MKRCKPLQKQTTTTLKLSRCDGWKESRTDAQPLNLCFFPTIPVRLPLASGSSPIQSHSFKHHDKLLSKLKVYQLHAECRSVRTSLTLLGWTKMCHSVQDAVSLSWSLALSAVYSVTCAGIRHSNALCSGTSDRLDLHWNHLRMASILR